MPVRPTLSTCDLKIEDGLSGGARPQNWGGGGAFEG